MLKRFRSRPEERVIERQRREKVVVGVLGSGRQSNGGRSNDRFEKLGVDLGNGAVNASKASLAVKKVVELRPGGGLLLEAEEIKLDSSPSHGGRTKEEEEEGIGGK